MLACWEVLQVEHLSKNRSQRKGAVESVVTSKDGKYIVAGCGDGSIVVLDLVKYVENSYIHQAHRGNIVLFCAHLIISICEISSSHC